MASASDSSSATPARSRLAAVIGPALWMATVGNVALWQQLWALPEVSRWRGVAFALGFAVLIAAGLVMLIAALGWGRLLRPLVSVLLVATAVGAHYMLAYNVVIDPTMMVNVLQTDPREVRDLLSWRLAAAFGLIALPPLWWLWRRPLARLRVWRQLGVHAALFVGAAVLASGALMAIFQDFSSVMRNHTQLRYLINPLNSVWALVDTAATPFKRDTRRIEPLGRDAQIAPRAPSAKPPLLVLVLGETARAENFSINGYARPTTPQLAREDVVSQRNAWSCGTSTAASVPCMFSPLPRDEFERRPYNTETLIDVLQHAGLAVLWLNNQSGCKGVCDRAPTVNTQSLQDPALCSGGECLDEIMLKGLDARIAALDAQRRARGVVLVLHQMGSHGPAYFKRSPAAFKRFGPECTTNALQECTREQVLNAYDNSLVYTDHFLARTIAWLKSQEAAWDPALIYVSDHGESLGENNLYLHGLPYGVAPDVQKHVPWITWLSPGFARDRGVSTACLKSRQDQRISHDDYFHSVLGLLGVQTSVYRPALDIYRPCGG
ncbi:phosphoethanolamine--lipid A transferase [Tibeticola sp.]|uniref:phosphoethanolamine transferase n=1 Tax=Tibeticola sp. TaxID=2005368 RepID=UPI0025FBD638|nr:phosphoethanolamine--lipid A transferase [Tibeticola sp.]